MKDFFLKDSDGKHEPIYCPCNGLDCPYYHDGICYERDLMKDCEEWVHFWSGWEEWEKA